MNKNLGWDRFKRSFGAAPSDDLIDNRLRKINLPLATAQHDIDIMSDAGIDTTGFVNRKTAVERDRDNALRLDDAKRKYAALDSVKDAARELAKETLEAAIDEIDDLHDRELAQNKAFQDTLAKANNATHPLVRGAASAARDQGEQNRDNAFNLANRTLTAAAMVQVNQTFAAAVEPLAKTGEAATKLGTDLPKLEQRTGKLIVSQNTKSVRDRAAKLRTDYDNLGSIGDIAELGKEVTRLAVELQRGDKLLAGLEASYKNASADIEGHLTAIAVVTDRARGMLVNGVEAVRDPLKVVDTAVADAKNLPDPLDQVKKLSNTRIDLLKAVREAMFSASDDDGGLASALSSAATMIGKLKEGQQKTTLTEQYDDLAERAATARKLEGKAASKAFATLKDEVRALIETAAKARGEDGFRDAIKSRFGIEIVEQPGAVYSLEKTYEMLDRVPDGHAAQKSLREIKFSAKGDNEGVYFAPDRRITLEKIQPDDTSTYTIGGKKVAMNDFNVTMLHEIGHAVDAKFGIMKAHGGNNGFGKWASISADNVIAAYTAQALKEMGNPTGELPAKAREAVKDAHDGKTVQRPDVCSAGQWKKLKKYTDLIPLARTSKNPWFNLSAKQAAVGDLIYVESTGGTWWSYDTDERAALEVRDYQWRSPAEWFAEIYAVSWMSKKITPSNVPGELAEYLPS